MRSDDVELTPVKERGKEGWAGSDCRDSDCERSKKTSDRRRPGASLGQSPWMNLSSGMDLS